MRRRFHTVSAHAEGRFGIYRKRVIWWEVAARICCAFRPAGPRRNASRDELRAVLRVGHRSAVIGLTKCGSHTLSHSLIVTVSGVLPMEIFLER